MEPIRPDEDELRATRDTNAGQPAKKPDKPAKSPGKKGGGNGGGGRQSPSAILLSVLLLVVAGAGAVGWYLQEQRIEQVEGQLEEADYWVRQSKLALARFQGELSETGENLQERGQSIEQRLSNQAARLDTADSEIRKLWGVANDRNKARLDDHEARLKALDNKVAQNSEQRQALATDVSKLEKKLGSELDALEASVNEKLVAQNARLDSQQKTLGELKSSLAAVDEQIESRLKRFQREQGLTIDGLEGRISALESTAQSLAGDELASLRSELASLRQTVASIDASRAQLTSRLVRLSEEVSQLRSKVAGQQQ